MSKKRAVYYKSKGVYVQDADTFRLEFLPHSEYQKQKQDILKDKVVWVFKNRYFHVQEGSFGIKVTIRNLGEYLIHGKRDGMYCNYMRLCAPCTVKLAYLTESGDIKISLGYVDYELLITKQGKISLVDVLTKKVRRDFIG